MLKNQFFQQSAPLPRPSFDLSRVPVAPWQATQLSAGFDTKLILRPAQQTLNQLYAAYAANQNPASSIEFFYMGLFYAADAQTCYLSINLVPPLANADKLCQQLRERNISFARFYAPFAYANRVRVGITTSDHGEILRFFAAIHDIAPLDERLQRACTNAAVMRDAIQNHAAKASSIRPFHELPRQDFWHPPILRISTLCESITYHPRYNPERHYHTHPLQNELLAAINDQEYARVKTLLDAHPELVVVALSDGRNPIWFSLDYGNIAITEYLLKVRENFAIDGDADAGDLMRMQLALKTLIQYNHQRFEHDKLQLDEFHEDPIHIAVKRGDVAEVQRLMQLNPACILSVNSMGHSPAEIAAGTNNPYLLYQLLSYSKKIALPRTMGNRILSAARTALCMLTALHFDFALDDIISRLHDAIKANECEVVAIMLDYGVPTHLQDDDNGMTALDLALQHAIKTENLSILNIFLARRTRPVVSGPYDDFVPHSVADRLEKHNSDLLKEIQKNAQLLKIVTPPRLTAEGHIETLFSDHEVTVSSIIRPVLGLSAKQMEEIKQIYDAAFDALVPPEKVELSKEEADKIKDYIFNNAFSDHSTDLVQLCIIHGKVASFFSFKIKPKEDCVAVIGILAAAHKQVAKMGLANLYNIILLAVENIFADKPVYSCYRCAPTFSWHMPPQHCSPRYFEINQERMQTIVEDNGGYPMLFTKKGISKTKLRGSAPRPNTAKADEFDRLRSNPLDVEKHDASAKEISVRGLVAYWEMKSNNSAELRNKIARHNIHTPIINQFAECLRTLLKLPKVEASQSVTRDHQGENPRLRAKL